MGNDLRRAIRPSIVMLLLFTILTGLLYPALLTGMEAPPNLGADYASSFRAVFAHLGQRPHLVFDPFFLEGVAGDPALNQADHIHPNPEGVKKEVARLLPLVERLLRQVAS